MDFIGVEEIQPYENIYEYKIFKYDDVIELGNNKNFICDLKFIKLNINPLYKEKEIEESVGYAIIENLNKNVDITLEDIEKKIKKFIIREIPLININEKSINVIFGLNK
ncbi:hypothetical protein [Tepidibacter formicigenes]|uniref:Uncharacterized protein n=1 Tax=Tepidibacter formicigenes DSM 15518 TaxID=1123349 RepID=A0A1M6MI70_9FIRM|nr:hypothetical protein [Tepidibacter formicigenes]SHJ82983.1 hypothetical protein SAMN02744037_00949 [Tepidibacter formicigenes DSM 15518]